MSRRGENIYKRKDGRWEGRYIKGRRENGNVHYGYIYGKTYKETKQKLLQFKLQYQEIRKIQGEYSGSCSQWFQQWLTEEVQAKVKLSTFASYQYKIRAYINPHIGTISLNRLTTKEIQELIKKWETQKLSINTMKVAFRILSKALETARKHQYIKENPCKDAELPKKKSNTVRALTLKEQRQLEETALEDAHGLPTLLALYTGLRMGEIAALKWENIDFDNQLIRVTHTYQRIPLGKNNQKTQLIYTDAKTLSSIRVIPFSSKVKKWLLEWQAHECGTFVFMKQGKMMEPRLFTYHFQKIVKKSGLSAIHFHQLRHTFATRCMESQGDVASVSALLGHASAKTTLDIYTDALLDQRRAVVSAMEKALN